MHSYNSVPNSDSEGHLPYFYLHIGVGHKVTKLLTCKYNVVYDFIAISTVEKGITEEPTKMARIKIDKTSPLVEVFQEDEDYKLVGEYDNWYFFEIDVEHFE